MTVESIQPHLHTVRYNSPRLCIYAYAQVNFKYLYANVKTKSTKHVIQLVNPHSALTVS